MEATPSRPIRDPFARPGQPGNRGLRYGSDGSIPAPYRASLDQAVDLAYRLNDKPSFASLFARTVSGLTGTRLGDDAYLAALDKAVVHLAETSRNQRIREELRRDAEAVARDPRYSPPPAFSIVGGRDVWLREAQLRKGPKAIAGSLLHEAAHLAGAPANPLAEVALEALHNASYPR